MIEYRIKTSLLFLILYFRWWNDLKIELIRQALSLRCNLIIGYTEQISIHRKVALLSCTGTAVSVISASSEHVPYCTKFHAACFSGVVSINRNINVCSCCKIRYIYFLKLPLYHDIVLCRSMLSFLCTTLIFIWLYGYQLLIIY